MCVGTVWKKITGILLEWDSNSRPLQFSEFELTLNLKHAVADPDEQAKIINKRQPPPVSPTKPSKTPPSPALKSPGPKTQAKPIPFVAPKPKTKSTSSDDYLGVIPPPPSVTAGMCVTARPTANHPPAHQGVATKPAVIPPLAHQGAASSNGVGQGASPPQEDDLPPWKKAMRDKKLKEQQVRVKVHF